MFDGVPEQFHQFIAPRTTTLPLHLSFPPPFDAYNPCHHHLSLPPPPPPPPNLLHPLHHKDEPHKQKETSINPEINQTETQLGHHQLQLTDSWTNDEVLALLRIRSSMDTWFPDLTWEHVSRKLAELGFKRSAEKCKEKFEEETRYFNNNNNNNNIHYTKNTNSYRFISDLEQLYQQAHPNPIPEVEVDVEPQKSKNLLEKPNHDHQEQHKMGEALEEDASVNTKQCEEGDEKKSKKHRKRKRHDKFEMLKCFCENMVNKMIAQQEQMHNKLLEDMLKRDQEKFEREEAWKKQEIDRMNRELEIMAKEQAIAGDRQATIIEFLKKFSEQNLESGGEIGKHNNLKSVSNSSNPNSLASSPLNSQNPNVGENNPEAAENPSSNEIPSSSNPCPIPENPNSASTQFDGAAAKSSCWSDQKDEVGRRWPREEVVALINLRCSTVNSNEEKEGNCRGPLWERISQGMCELGYKRSAKRCKEKWENINKYFRKTKDVSKKRSLHSRTCPYFHQLTTLYAQAKLLDDNTNNHTLHPPQLDYDAAPHKTAMQNQIHSPPPPPALDFHHL